MNAAGRGPRLGGKDDFYETPAWCVNRLFDAWKPSGVRLVEPCVGNGAIVRAVNARYGLHNWTCYDIRDTDLDLGETEGRLTHFAPRDFLAIQVGDFSVNAVITNPPYSLAEDFLRRSRTLYPNAEIVFLLRMAFLASETRIPIWASLGVPDVFVLPNRPSFANEGKTDSADYAWFVWPVQGRTTGDICVLPSTPKIERGRR